ncbi:hypothetical protein [Agrobacterium sp. B1(2019)]|uniref:hypothetical protein n=1 Tax=Agrobacterium sp. B1(2019) TaxID=2607032 RepID=UPI0011EF3DFE|nr:hypothetical protein [Agrobacterium sp. B1(2019)]TZG36618.1 hypothetical protein AGR1_03730 [Agrobacterium sp. B1(2019)]
MRAFFMAILMAMARLAEGGLKGFEWCWQKFLGLLPGGGGGGTVMPPQKLDLPDVDEAKYVQDRAVDQQKAADYILSSPERVAMAWAQALPEHRDTIPLTRLTPDQIDWLEVHLTDDQIKILASEKSERKIADAMAGREDAIFGVPSVGQTKKRESDPVLSDRIAAFRNGCLERPPAYVN